MNLKKILFTLLIFTCHLLHTQNMQEGFNYLETGKYAEATTFFKAILKEYPNNKTAKLCYGRAIGLTGKTEEAVHLFTDILKVYPTDFEIKLNYAEALLWNKNFTNAKIYYEKLIVENSSSFSATLGYANTLSNLKLYKDALGYINKALELDPNNKNALTSKKYIYLGYAYQEQQQQNYIKSEELLQENLSFFEDDIDTLLNLANLYLITSEYDKALEIYQRINNKPDLDVQVKALNGLALVAHLKSKEKRALNISKQAYNSIPKLKNLTTINQTKERYIQALIWNKKYTEPKLLINDLIEEYPNENWVLALRATLNIYKSNFKKSLTDYNQIIANDSSSFDGNLGKANALKAVRLYDDAYTSADNTLDFYNNQKDAVNFITTLNSNFTPFSETKAYYSFDNGDNTAHAFKIGIVSPVSTKLKWLANYSYRKTNNTTTNDEAVSNDFLVGLSYQLLPNITFKGETGVIFANANSDEYSQLITDFLLHIIPTKLQVLDIGYKRNVQNFNAELLEREIVMNDFYANYNLSTNFKLGWFTQYYYTSQSDDNTRNLLFTSLYYNLLSKPVLKAGVNYQYITFKNQVPAIYFSPEKFNAVEIFVDLIKDEAITKPNEFFYGLTAATGFQFIEDEPKQRTYRIQSRLGYKFSERALLNTYGNVSNIASTTVAGFAYAEIGIRFKWYLAEKPIFR